MITSADIDAMEERLLRICPYVDVTTVNVLRREIQFLRGLVNTPCARCIELKEAKHEQVSEQSSVPVKKQKTRREDKSEGIQIQGEERS